MKTKNIKYVRWQEERMEKEKDEKDEEKMASEEGAKTQTQKGR